MNNIRRAPVVNLSATLNRVLVMFIAIILGVILSYTTADAGVRIEKGPYSKSVLKSVQKKKSHNYSCKVLMEKHRSTSNIVVKSKTRRPKWR